MSIGFAVLWLVIASSVLALTHVYLFKRLVKDAALPEQWQRRIKFGLVALALTTFSLFMLARTLPRPYVTPLGFLVYLWMGFFSVVTVLLLATELFRFPLFLLRRKSEAKTSDERRTFLRRLFAGSVASAGTLITGYSTYECLTGFKTVRLDIRLAKLPKSFDGYRIVQVSDIHIGPTIGRDFIEEMVFRGNAEKPDLVAITGDLVDGSVAHLAAHAAPLKDFKGKDGTFFVTGNHEYYSGVEEWIEELARLGIPTLRNSRTELRRGGDVVDLLGVTDHRAGQYGDAPKLKEVVEGRDRARESILLAHQPIEVFEAQKHDIGLQLSGHTHGGQYWPFSWLIYLVQPVVKGLARFGRTQVYVSSGTGYWGPPARSGTEAELTVITLRCA